ncbi:MAG: hypothetical protein NC310_08580 [Roseburia sp.]|nr:hypothetical protein [Anaeroplasma bactoclasticum]MCM1197103.1 hypothetical protein [Roseburia sp.]MCM1556381.1 hypothetical protein [Anaeroplasma bactoclasticum]
MQSKYLIIKKFGWKRVAKNTQKFGWILNNAEEERETTTTTTYEGEVVNNEIRIHEHTSSSTKVSVHLYFVRDPNDFENLKSIVLIELLYNIAFLVRRIIGFVLPIATAIMILLSFIGFSDMVLENSATTWWGIGLFSWIGLIILESILPSIAKRILRWK